MPFITGDNLNNIITPTYSSLLGPRPGAGADTIDGRAGNDSLDGGGGDDKIIGGAGRDSLYGGDGDDYITDTSAPADAGVSIVDGGAGNDTVSVTSVGNSRVTGGSGNDSIDIDIYSSDDAVFYPLAKVHGGTGDDTIHGVAFLAHGIDLYGDEGNDSISGGGDEFHAYGGSGNDTIHATASRVVVQGGDGDDAVLASGIDISLEISGDAGNDILAVEFLSNWAVDHASVYGGSGNDTLRGADSSIGSGNELLDGGAGNDSVEGGPGNDTLFGGNGNDALDGGADNDLIDGGDGLDTIYGGAGNDSVTGGAGDDLIFLDDAQDNYDDIGGGNDTIDGGAGDDFLWGSSGNESYLGGAGDDALLGEQGNDTLVGGAGNDYLEGGSGNDVLKGLAGRDTLVGGDDNDIFVFNATSDSPVDSTAGATNGDEIIAFIGVGAANIDRIDLSAIDANPGVAGNQAFVFIGTAAFSAVGQVRVFGFGADTIVQVNTVGTRGAEMEIQVDDGVALPNQWVASDFIL